jgi:hypothetical protein
MTTSLDSSMSEVGTASASSGTGSATLTRLEGTAGFRVVLVSVLAGIGCFLADVLVSGSFVVAAFATVALVDPVARVEPGFEVEEMRAAAFVPVLLAAAVFDAAVLPVAPFGAALADSSDAKSAFFGRPRRAGAFKTLALNSASGAMSSPLAWARCARVRTIANVGQRGNAT